MATPAMRRAFQEARTEFKELSIQELKDYEALFVKYDTGKVRDKKMRILFCSYSLLGWLS